MNSASWRYAAIQSVKYPHCIRTGCSIHFCPIVFYSDKVSENFDAVGRYFTNVGEKLELDKLARKAGEQGEKLVEIDQDFERLGTALDTQMQTFTQDLENRTVALVGSINDELKQTAETIRVKAESIIGSLGQSVQAQLSSFWKSLIKDNE